MTSRTLAQHRALVLLRAICGLEIFMAPVLTVFYLEYVHVDFKMFSFYQAFIMVLSAVLEVPTGAIADVYGRKKTFLISQVIYFFALIFLLVFPGIASLLAAAVLLPFAISLGSGNFEALIYESFAKNECLSQYKSLMERSHTISLVTGILGAFFGGYLAKKSLAFPVILDCASILIVTAGSLFFLHENHDNQTKTISSCFKKSKLKIIDTSIMILKNKNIFILIMTMGTLFAIIRGIFLSYQPLLLDVGLSYASLGIIFAFFGFISAFFSYLVPKFGDKYGDLSPRTMTLILTSILMISAILFQLQHFLAVFIAIALHQVVRGVFLPFFRFHINTNVGHDFSSRATLLSVVSLVSSGICAIGVFLVGFIESRVNLVIGVSAVIGCFSTMASLPWLISKCPGATKSCH